MGICPEATDGQMKTHVNGVVSEMLTSVRMCQNETGEAVEMIKSVQLELAPEQAEQAPHLQTINAKRKPIQSFGYIYIY